MNRRSTGAGRFWRPALITLLWASQLLAVDGRREAAGNLPAGAAYLGQTPPGETPALFAPGSLSASRYLGRLAFSPDGLECFFTADDATYSTMSLLVTRFVNGAWEAPAPAPFTSGFEKYFLSNRSGSPPVYRALQSPDVHLGAGFNTDADEYGATLSPDGKYLFFVRHSALKGEIYLASTRAIEKLRR